MFSACSVGFKPHCIVVSPSLDAISTETVTFLIERLCKGLRLGGVEWVLPVIPVPGAYALRVMHTFLVSRP